MIIHNRLLSWWNENKRSFIWREFIFSNNESFKLNNKIIDRSYALFIAEFLLMRTNAPQVSLVYENFLSIFPDFSSIIDSKNNDLLAIFSNNYSFKNPELDDLFPVRLGFDKRASWLVNISKKVYKDPEILNNLESLLELDGLGQYTARAFLVQYLNKNFIPLDTNIVRFFVRVYGFSGLTEQRRNKKFDASIQKFVYEADNRLFFNSLLDFMALICTPYEPKCTDCPINNICCFYNTLQTISFGSDPILIPDFDLNGLKYLLSKISNLNIILYSKNISQNLISLIEKRKIDFKSLILTINTSDYYNPLNYRLIFESDQ